MSDNRGQTAIDFAIDIVVFLGVVLFVFTFVPGSLEPFDLGGEEEPAVSNQIADSLTQDVLGSPERPHVLDTYIPSRFSRVTEVRPVITGTTARTPPSSSTSPTCRTFVSS